MSTSVHSTQLELRPDSLPVPSTETQDKAFEIPHLTHPEYEVFFRKFLQANTPCIVAGACDGWECAKKWVSDGNINHDYISAQYGDMKVSLSDCNSDCEQQESTVRAYIEYLSGKDGARATGSTLYLKDWHLRRERPNDKFYRVPAVFASDWLNEYSLDKGIDDFMFVYIGPKGSWTAIHADVYSSFSWSVNVVGRKRWKILPPGEEQKLLDGFGRLPLDFQPRPDVRCLDVVQEAGEAIFVPSGWYHTVHNELDTISVNHNWVNGCNVSKVWEALQRALGRVESELDDLRSAESFVEDCQRVLRCDHGLDYAQFVQFLVYIGRKRLKQRRLATLGPGDGLATLVPGDYHLGPGHIEFDLRAVLCVISAMLVDERVLEGLTDDQMSELTALKCCIETENG